MLIRHRARTEELQNRLNGQREDEDTEKGQAEPVLSHQIFLPDLEEGSSEGENNEDQYSPLNQSACILPCQTFGDSQAWMPRATNALSVLPLAPLEGIDSLHPTLALPSLDDQQTKSILEAESRLASIICTDL